MAWFDAKRPEIVLVFDVDCPNVESARSNLRKAVTDADLADSWHEIDQHDPATPVEYRYFGSPTILVDGQDVAGGAPGPSGDCCRLYHSSDGGYLGAPSVEQITAALASVSGHSPDQPLVGARWQGAILSIPAVAVGLLPSVTCPACWPAYAAFLGTLGVGFIPTDGLLLPLTIVALVLVLVAIAWRAIRVRRWGALILGAAVAVALVVGRFVLAWPTLQYTGVVGLVAASIWNIALKQRAAAKSKCPKCAPAIPPEKLLDSVS